jgi:putative flippase GtrA
MLARAMRDVASHRRVALFIAVGCSAALVHWLIVVGLVSAWHWHPLAANVCGWLGAFGVSFAGHQGLTFRGHGRARGAAAVRFLAVSAAGFAINEAAYALLLHFTGQRYDLVLAAVLILVAVLTYRLSRHWVFPGTPP